MMKFLQLNGGRFNRASPAAISYFDAKIEFDSLAGSGGFDLISECRQGRGGETTRAGFDPQPHSDFR